MIKLPIFILIWALFFTFKAVVLLTGLFVVPVLYLYRKRPFDEVPKVFLPWQNPEDWNGGHRGTEHSLPQWWINQCGFGFWSWYKYHAIRNPANGLRNFESLDLDIEPSKVQFVATGEPYRLRYEPTSMRKDGIKFASYLAWQGLQAGCKVVYVWNAERHFVFKFGWRIEPKDRDIPIDPDGTRVDDAGFASKLLPYREG